MLIRAFFGPEAAGFVIVGATAGAVIAHFAHPCLMAAWAGGTAGALLLPVIFGLPWDSAIRRVAGLAGHFGRDQHDRIRLS